MIATDSNIGVPSTTSVGTTPFGVAFEVMEPVELVVRLRKIVDRLPAATGQGVEDSR